MRRWLIGLIRMGVVVSIATVVLMLFTALMTLMWEHPDIVKWIIAALFIGLGSWVVGPSDPKEGFIPKWN
jgi:hypothetical protein